MDTTTHDATAATTHPPWPCCTTYLPPP